MPLGFASLLGGSITLIGTSPDPSNTLVMGPGGYHFADYWKLGLPLSLIVIALGVPLILVFWPLG